VSRSLGNGWSQRTMGGVDVRPQPVPDGHRFGRPTQQTGVHVAVVEARDHRVFGRIHNHRLMRARVGIDHLFALSQERVKEF